MAAPKREQAPQFRTPKGVFVFPKLNEPDTKFNPAGEYSVKLKLAADDAEVKALLARLEPLHEAAVAAGEVEFNKLDKKQRVKLGAHKVNPLFSEVYDEDENPTGFIELKFGMKASGVYKDGKKAGQTWYRTPAIFDKAGESMGTPWQLGEQAREEAARQQVAEKGGSFESKQRPPAIWGGTEGKVAFEVRSYFIGGTGTSGLTLALQAVQISKLVSGGGRTASAYGFEAEPDDESETAPTGGEDDF